MMAVEKQLQFREHIKKKCKPWDSNIEFAMPGKLALYRDYKPMVVAEYTSAGKKRAKKSVEVRSQHHIFLSPLAWTETAEASGFRNGSDQGAVNRFAGLRIHRAC
jgi:hypothetical protein